MNDQPLRSDQRREDPRRTLGATGEQLAAEHLVRRGFTIVEQNFRNRWGELDIVACDGHTLVFCEVKTRRSSGAASDPLESVRHGKRTQVRRMAARWLTERRDRPRARELRFDAIGVTLDPAGRLVRLDHLEGAF
jgi:putative endonuclease